MNYNPGQPPQYGYPGPQPTQGYPGPQPTQGYPGPQPTQGYPGMQQPLGFPAQAPPPIDPNVASWFKAVDQDNSGVIDFRELQLALQNGNRSTFSDEACKLMIGMFDTDRTGTMNIEEFSRLFGYVNQWTDVYRRYDRDQSGTIDEGEMASALQQMGYRLSPQFVSLLVGRFDPKLRKITLDNFIVANVKINKLTEMFREKDIEMRGVASLTYEDFLSMAMRV